MATDGLSTASSTLSIPNPTIPPLSATFTGTSNPDATSEAEKIFYNAVTATNAISLAACIIAISAYFVLWRKNPRLMSRTSLKLSIAVTCSDTIYHCANFTGYFNLPGGFVCAFVGGWMFTTPTFLSIFYACAIALNTQLVFVHKWVPKDDKQILFLLIPLILALLITTPTLIAGVYGFDETLDFCWYNTHNISAHTILLRTLLTWDLWLFIALVYLIVAVAMITHCFFGKRDLLSTLTMSEYLRRHPSRTHSTPTIVNPTLAAILAKGGVARRALTVRVLGYIIVPIICIFPTVIICLIGQARSDSYISPVLRLIAAVTASLMGTCNTILLAFDPSVIAVVFWPHWKKKKERERIRKRNTLTQQWQRPDPPAFAATCDPPILEAGDPETTERDTQDMTLPDDGLEFYGHLEVQELTDFEISLTSTIGYNTDELAEIFHGL